MNKACFYNLRGRWLNSQGWANRWFGLKSKHRNLQTKKEFSRRNQTLKGIQAEKIDGKFCTWTAFKSGMAENGTTWMSHLVVGCWILVVLELERNKRSPSHFASPLGLNASSKGNGSAYWK